MADNFLPLTAPPIYSDPAVEAAGVNAVPSSLGDVFSGALETNPTTELANASTRDMAISGYGIEGAPVASAAMLPGAEPSVDAATLNDKYSIPARANGSGGLSFTNPLPDSVASSMYDDKRAELMRESVGARRPAGLLNSAAGLGTQFAAGALDPLNLAASFIPVVGEARYASWLADAGSAIARTGIRAGVGAAQGAVGTAPIAALQYGLSREEGGDMTASDALLNIAFGSVLGGGLHASLGALGDAISPFKSNPARMASGVDTAASALADAPLSTREAALRSSIAQLVSGQPVEVEPFFAGNELGGYRRTLADLDNEDAAMMAEPAQNPALQNDLETIRGNKAQPQPAQSFMSAIRAQGPIKDEQGELASLGITSRSNPGLVSARGKPLDDVTRDLWEQGWFPEAGTERPMISDLLSAIYNDQHGSPRIHPDDMAAVTERELLGSLDEQLHGQGIDLRGMSNGDVERAMNGQPVDRGPVSLADHDAQDAAYAAITGDRFTQAAKLASGERHCLRRRSRRHKLTR